MERTKSPTRTAPSKDECPIPLTPKEVGKLWERFLSFGGASFKQVLSPLALQS